MAHHSPDCRSLRRVELRCSRIMNDFQGVTVTKSMIDSDKAVGKEIVLAVEKKRAGIIAAAISEHGTSTGVSVSINGLPVTAATLIFMVGDFVRAG